MKREITYPVAALAIAFVLAIGGFIANRNLSSSSKIFADAKLYSDTDAGYRFHYPANSILSDGKAGNKKYKNVFLYFYPPEFKRFQSKGCSVKDNMNIQILENPDKLSLEKFINTGLTFKASYSDEVRPKLSAAFDASQMGQKISVGGKPALRFDYTDNPTSDLVLINGLSTPVVFVAHEDRVIRIAVGATSPMGAYPPCSETNTIFQNILNTMEWT
jgi:hypothetical protein